MFAYQSYKRMLVGPQPNSTLALTCRPWPSNA